MSRIILLASLILSCTTTCVHASVFTGDETFTYTGSNEFDAKTVSFTGLPTAPSIGDATVKVTVKGDFSNAAENFMLTLQTPDGVESLFMGTGLNADNASGEIQFPMGDAGGTAHVAEDASLDFVISSANFSALLLHDGPDPGTAPDGLLDFVFSVSTGGTSTSSVNSQPGDFFKVDLSYGYELTGGSSAPEPSTFILGGLAALLLGVCVYRRRHRRAA